MGLFDKVFKRSTAVDSGTTALIASLNYTENITVDTALEIPAFSSSIDFVANTIAMLPVKLYRENTKEQKTDEVVDDVRVKLLNDETGDLLTAYEMKRALVRDHLLTGAGYIYVNKKGNRVESLHYVENSYVSVLKDNNPIFKTATVMINGRNYDPFDLIVLTRNSTDGLKGKGIVDEHKQVLGAAYAEFKLENKVANSGGTKKGFLQTAEKLDDEGMSKLRQRWYDLYSNANSGVMILNEGLKFTEASNTSVELQLNQNKMTNTAQIAMIFGLSQEVISGKATREQYTASIKTGVIPIIENLTAALNKALLLEVEKSTMYFKIDVDELLKGDTLTRYQAYEIGLRNNFLRLDEIRYKEDLEPINFNWMKLGLDSVLYDPVTKQIYTANTNTLKELGSGSVDNKQSKVEGVETSANSD